MADVFFMHVTTSNPISASPSVVSAAILQVHAFAQFVTIRTWVCFRRFRSRQNNSRHTIRLMGTTIIKNTPPRRVETTPIRTLKFKSSPYSYRFITKPRHDGTDLRHLTETSPYTLIPFPVFVSNFSRLRSSSV